MGFVPIQKPDSTRSRRQTIGQHGTSKAYRRSGLPSHCYKQMVLLILTVLMALGSIVFSYNQQTAFAADPGSGYQCAWYIVHRGETLSAIASSNNTTMWRLASVNHIRNVNLIVIGQRLCIPYGEGGVQARQASGILTNGTVRWYAYNALDWSTRGQVVSMLRLVAARYSLPANLLLAIAWQESGWDPHVNAWDGGSRVIAFVP